MNTIKTNSVLITLSLLFVIIGCVLYLNNNLVINTDISQFMPSGTVESEQSDIALVFEELQKGKTTKLLLVSISSDNLHANAALSNELKNLLQKSDLFGDVFNNETGQEFLKQDVLFKYRYLLDPTINAKSFSEEELEKSLNQRLGEVRSGFGIVVKKYLSSDPTNSYINYLANVIVKIRPNIKHGVWVSKDERSALLLVKINVSGFDVDRQEKAIKYVKESYSAINTDHAAQLDITGPGTFAVATREKIKFTLTVLSIVASVFIISIFWFAYRRINLLLLLVIPLVSAVIIALAATNLIFEEINGITLAFGITLLAVCIDYPIHLFSHLNSKVDVHKTVKSIWPTLRLGVYTTSLGYIVFLGNDFKGLEQLSVFAIVGLLTAAYVTRLYLPVYLKARNTNYETGWLLSLIKITNISNRNRFFIIGVMALLSILPWLIYKDNIWQQDIAELSPIPKAERLKDKRMRTALSVPELNHIFIVSDTDAEATLLKTEKLKSKLVDLKDQSIVKDISVVTDILPSRETQRKRKMYLPEKIYLEQSLFTALKDLPFKAGIFNNFIDDVEKSKGLTPLELEDLKNTQVYSRIENNFFQKKEKWISIIRVHDIVDEAIFKNWLNTRTEVKKHYYNLHKTTSALLTSYRSESFKRLILGGGFMLIFLFLAFRSVEKTFRIAIPVLLAVSLSLSIQVVFGVKISLFHLMSALLVAGIGIDYCLFFNRSLDGGIENLRNLHGIIISAISTCIGFGILVFSGLPVLQSIGQTVALGVIICFSVAFVIAGMDASESSIKHS